MIIENHRRKVNSFMKKQEKSTIYKQNSCFIVPFT